MVYMQARGRGLCSHSPITEHCVVGNCCVKRFLGEIASEKVFAALRRVSRDGSRALNQEVIQFASAQGWLSDWDCTFYLDTVRKRSMTEKQQEHRERINQKVLARVRDPEANGAKEAEHWSLDPKELKAAFEGGRITNWELDFYTSNLGRTFVTERQRPIKERVEAKVAKKSSLGSTALAPEEGWTLSSGDLERAMNQGFISEWERGFYAGNIE